MLFTASLMQLIDIILAIVIGVNFGSLVSCSSNSENDFQDWKLILYTGDKLWAGTDSEIYIELVGVEGNSRIIEIKPRKHQLEADAIDTFSLGKLTDTRIGQLKSIVIGKQHSYSFFNDWQLIKAEVVDPQGKKYIFSCNCWLTTHKFKRLIHLTATEGGPASYNDSSGEFNGFTNSRSTRVFPLTIGVLFLLLVLITFTYFGNEICKKWKENILFFNSTTRPGQNSFTSNRTETRSRSPRSSRRETTEYATNVLLQQGHIPLNAIIEDKPPEYKELFPNVAQSLRSNEQSFQVNAISDISSISQPNPPLTNLTQQIVMPNAIEPESSSQK